jgi:hypothetical protein
VSKPYWSGGHQRGPNFLDDPFDESSPTGRISTRERYNDGFYSNGGYRTTEDYRRRRPEPDHSEDDAYEYEDYDEDVYYHSDTRWRLIAGLAVAVLLAAVLAIVLVMRGGDDTQNTAQSSPATSTTPRTVVATIPPSPAPPPPVQLSPETVVTITTTPPAPSPVATVPPATAVPAPEVAPAPAAAAVDPRTVTYTVTGTKQMIDLVSVIYTDEQGMPRTEVNVALPWSKTLVLNPGVDFESVTATSLTGQLNCAITDAAGAPVVTQNNNSMIATCTG